MSVRANVPAPDDDVADDADTVLARSDDEVFDVEDDVDDATVAQFAQGSDVNPVVPAFVPPPGWVPPPPTPTFVPPPGWVPPPATPTFVPPPGWVPPPADLTFPPPPSDNGDALPEIPEGPSPEDIAAQEQEELLSSTRKRAWHQRTWLRFLLVLVVMAGIAAVIPYPLRITAECTIIPRERVRVRSELQGVIAEILVEEGQQVKAGDIIARIDDRALKADRRKALAEIERYEAEVAILKSGHRDEEIQRQEAILAARKSEVGYAAKEAHRRNLMAKQGVGSRQAADEANGEYEKRKRAVTEAEAQLRLLKAGSRPEEIAAREAVLKKTQAELEYVDQKIAMTVVRAPIDGEILTPRFRERLNEGVEMGGLICEIANTKIMRAEVLVPQRDVDAIAVGMPVTVKVESHPTHPFEGKVAFVSPSVDGEERRLRVVAELDNSAGLLKPNMTGYGEIESGDRSLLHLATRRIVRWIRVRFLL